MRRPPRGQLRQPPQGNAHASNAGIVHERGCDHIDVMLDKGSHKLFGLPGAGLPLGDVHGTKQ